MITINNNKYAREILKVVASSGAFPKRMVGLASENRRMVLRETRELLQTREVRGKIRDEPILVKIFELCRDKYGGTLRIRESALPLLDDALYPGASEDYLRLTNGHQFKYDEKHIHRAHRVGESVCMAYRAGCRILGGGKPSVLGADTLDVGEIVYYHPAEFKSRVNYRQSDEHKKRVMASSTTGLILSPGGVYMVYNTGRGVMKWNEIYELSAREEALSFAKSKYDKEVANRLPMTLENMIVFGRKPEQLVSILSNTRDDGRAGFSFNLNTAYSNKYFLPLDERGIFQLRVLLQNSWKERILAALFSPEQLSSRPPFVADVFFENTAVILGFDLNLMKIRLFGNSARQMSGRYKFKLACFDWQAEIMREIMPDNVSLVVIDEEKIAEVLGVMR